MNPYNQNDELIVIDENFINGYLSPIALLRDYTTYEVGFNYYFKRLEDGPSLKESLFSELRGSFKRFVNRESKRYKSHEEVEELISKGIQLIEIENWNDKLASEIDFWTGTTITNTIKEECKMRVWEDKPNLLSLDLIELLKVFFHSKSVKAYKFKGEICGDLYYHWGGINYLDILFSNENENYLLHFDLSD